MCSTVAAFFLVAACGSEIDEGATTATHPLVVGSTVIYEAEVLTRTASATGSQVTAETGASAGKYVQLSGTPGAGAWIQFTLTNVEAGSYDLKLLYKSNYNRGIVQASIDGTNQGSSCSQYTSAATQQVACSLGNRTLTAGSHVIRFTVTGKSAASAGYMMVLDQISLKATSTNTGGTGGAGGASAGAGGNAAGSGGSAAGAGGSAAGAGGSAAGSGGSAAGAGGSAAGAGGSAAGSGGSAAGAGGSAAGSGGSAAGAGGSAAACTATNLKQAASCTGRRIGAALSTTHLQEAAYANAAREFNFVTPENEMKWTSVEPNRNQFSYGGGDQIVNFASSNGMKVKGHTLVWHSQLPTWVSNISNATDLRSVMVNHITKVVQHYRGKVVAWDVVNEAWGDSDPPTLRDSVFTRVLGATYIDDAFNAARAADPDAKLYYNDYSADGLSAKSDAVYAMVRGMKERGVPIDGVGLQMHWRPVGSTLTAAEVSSNIQRLAALGVEVVISEMVVELCNGGTLSDQQARFHDIVAACMSQPACTAVTFWGVTDKYSWLNSVTDLGCTATETPRPLLLDNNYNKKLAYTGAMNALLGH